MTNDFTAFEAAGWQERARPYDVLFAPIVEKLVGPLLDAAQVRAGQRVLDVATGPGYLAAEAVHRGAEVVGVDIAAAMVALAGEREPGLRLVQADMQALPFADNGFDAVVAGLALMHVSRPYRAVGEWVRVVRPGGVVALSVWDRPERCRLAGVVLGSADELWEGMLGATVRTSAVVAGQPVAVRRRIREAFDSLVEPYATDRGVEIPVAARVSSGRKP